MTQPDDREMLPEEDRLHLDDKEYDYEVRAVAGELDVVIHAYPLPSAYSPRACDLLVRLPAGYPNANPDMFWTYPDVRLAKSGEIPAAASHSEPYLGHAWQRWSRHFGSWRAGIDGLRSYLGAIRKDLEKGI